MVPVLTELRVYWERPANKRTLIPAPCEKLLSKSINWASGETGAAIKLTVCSVPSGGMEGEQELAV